MTKKFGIVKALGLVLLGAAVGGIIDSSLKNKVIDKETQRVNKFKDYYNLLNEWLIIKQEGKSLAHFFEKHGYKSIAIYGMGELGNRLYEELKDTEIEVKYAIDKNAGNTYSELEVYELEDELAEVDVIVVTAIFAFEEIEKVINEVADYPIISLEDVIFGL